MNIRQRNLAKIKELQPHVQYAAKSWEVDCWDAGWEVEFLEVYRTQERQEQLYSIGRRDVVGERKVTFTKRSKHTERLAIDCRILNRDESYSNYFCLEKLGNKYGITHPLAGPPFYDLRHFQLDEVPPKDIDPSQNRVKMIHIRRLRRFMKRLVKRPANVIKRAKERIKKRYPFFRF